MTKKDIKTKLEAIRQAIRAENISYGEIAELQSLAQYIDSDDVELLEWAGVPEHFRDGDFSLIDVIAEEMLSDDEDRTKQSEYLEEAYLKADKSQKQAIDDCFIALCGWSLGTMIKNRGK